MKRQTFEVVPFDRSHIPAVAGIERICFAEPWSENALELFAGDGAFAFAAVSRDRVPLGYAGMLIAADEGQLLNLAVLPEARRQGIGAALLSALLSEAERRGLRSVSLEVRVSNQAAIRLYERFGFRSVGVRKHFYRHPAEDASVMIRDLSEPS